ncbi:hypothetical protein CKF58_06100 [Psittacicella hinzii]|uniref:Uncharacterized protein n=1 Tax=Psittacicella hinzii TaxID=2028575 RepID=A0A3A1YFY9_9GAMM|nr:hypothetical protein CKF58_06100 [Psittacicella hinzii]
MTIFLQLASDTSDLIIWFLWLSVAVTGCMLIVALIFFSLVAIISMVEENTNTWDFIIATICILLGFSLILLAIGIGVVELINKFF